MVSAYSASSMLSIFSGEWLTLTYPAIGLGRMLVYVVETKGLYSP